MASELTLVLWFDEGTPVPTNEEIEQKFECAVIERDEEEC